MFENFAPTLADKNHSGTTGTNGDRRFKPVFIHSNFDDLPLSVEAYRVYCHLARRANDQNVCWPSYRSIGEVCFRGSNPNSNTNTLRRKAITAMQELIRVGLVLSQAQTFKDSNARSSNLYVLTDETCWKNKAVNIKSARRRDAKNAQKGRATRGVMVQDSNAENLVLSQHQGGVAGAPEVVFPQRSGGVARAPEVVLHQRSGGVAGTPEVLLRERSGGVAGTPEVVLPQHQGGAPLTPGVVLSQHQGGVLGAPKVYPIELYPIELSPSPPDPPQGGLESESFEQAQLTQLCGSIENQDTPLLEVKSFSLDLTAPNSLKNEKPIKYDPALGMRPPRQRPKFMYPDGPWLNQDGTINGNFIRAQADLWRTGDSTVSKAFGAMAIEEVEAKVCGHYMRRENHAKLEVDWNAYCKRSQRYAANVQARLASGGTVGADEQKKIVSLIPAIACDIEPVYSPPVVQCPQVPTLMLQSAESTPSAASSPRPIELDLNRVPLEGQTTEGADAYQLFKSQSLPPVSSPPPDFFAKLKTKMSTPAVNSRDRQRSALDIPAIEQMLKSGGGPTDESEYARQQRAIARRWLSHNGS